ncbi:MAG TPA: hypothetical protein VII49_12495 [Rhizomicrobium sp.]
MKYVPAALGGASLLALAALPAFAQGSIAMDQPVTIGAVDTVCTGIGDDAQHDPRWLAYPVRIEFSNGGAQYLSGAHVELSTASGQPLAALDCAGPWVLFKLGPGHYKVNATLTGQQGGGTSSATFSPPEKGQKRVVLGFHIQPNQ